MKTGSEALLGQPWDMARKGIASSESLNWIPACHSVPKLLWACGDGPLVC